LKKKRREGKQKHMAIFFFLLHKKKLNKKNLFCFFSLSLIGRVVFLFPSKERERGER